MAPLNKGMRSGDLYEADMPLATTRAAARLARRMTQHEADLSAARRGLRRPGCSGHKRWAFRRERTFHRRGGDW